MESCLEKGCFYGSRPVLVPFNNISQRRGIFTAWRPEYYGPAGYGSRITGKAASRLGNTTVITGNPDYPGNYR